MEFQEADKNVRDLITEYQDKQVQGVKVGWPDALAKSSQVDSA